MNKSNELPYFKQTTSKEKKGGVGIMKAQEINQEINLLAEKVKKLAVRDFKKILEKKLSIDDLEAEVVKLNVDNIFRGLYLNELHSLYSEYKKNIQIQFPIPEYLED